MGELDRERPIKFGKEQAAEGAGPVTVGMDLGHMKTIFSHAAAVHGISAPVEPINLARIALGRLGLVGKGNERDRHPTQDELDRIIATLEANERQQSPVDPIVRFAVATKLDSLLNRSRSLPVTRTGRCSDAHSRLLAF